MERKTGTRTTDKARNICSFFPKDLFAFKINYETPEIDVDYSAIPLYNGNISEVYWRSSNDNIKRKYSFDYDKLNRLTDAKYIKPDADVPLTNAYNENMRYDKNGNIIFLNRYGGQDLSISNPLPIDELNYSYLANTNKLAMVYDGSNSSLGFKDNTGATQSDPDDYSYDTNGNLLSDNNKGISSIKYNHLNLPTEIIFANNNLKKITYLYDASGDKLQKVVANGTSVVTTDYLDGFQYKNAVLEFFPHGEGYVVNTQTTTINGVRVDNYNYVYNYLDHLGNVRVSYTWDTVLNGLKIIEENGHYPFGLKHNGYNGNLAGHKAVANDTKVDLRGVPGGDVTVAENSNQTKFNHRQWQSELGLNVTDMDFRQYDNAIGRFVCVDLLSEANYSQSPYHFANNNPMFWADPSGMDGITITIDWNSIPDNSTTNINFLHSWEEVDNAEGDVYVFGQDGSVNLPAVTVGFNFSTGQYASNAGSVIQQHIYNNSPYYQSDFVSTGKKSMIILDLD